MSSFNERCAARAGRILEAFNEDRSDGGSSPEEDLTDLFTDLMHFGSQNGVDYEACFATARTHFITESSDPILNEEGEE